MKVVALCVTAMLAFVVHCFGQDKKFEEAMPDIEWGQGSILLNTGEELKGLLRFNDRNGGVISFEAGSDARSLTARSVAGFEFFDEVEQRQRVFYSLEYEDVVSGARRPLFFEVLTEFDAFAVLTKMDPVKLKENSSNGSQGYYDPATGTNFGKMSASYKMKITQTETIYFMNGQGALEPYISITRKVVDRDLYDRTKMKRKYVDDDVVKKYFSPAQIQAMEKFADENDLDFKVKDDLRKILASIK